MARYMEACQHVLTGLTPPETARRMGISLGTVRQYLCQGIGEGELRPSDIAFTISERRLIESVLNVSAYSASRTKEVRRRIVADVFRALSRKGEMVPRELIELYLMVRDPRTDLYALICEAEVLLHAFVKETLAKTYLDRWWQEGIPLPIRQSCQNRREEDSTPLEPYHYTTFIDLKRIIDNKWPVFVKAFPDAMSKDKPRTLDTFQNLNEIRNRVMHPVKVISEYENDYRFVRTFLSNVQSLASG